MHGQASKKSLDVLVVLLLLFLCAVASGTDC